MIVIVKAMLVMVIVGAMVKILMGINQLFTPEAQEDQLSPVMSEVEKKDFFQKIFGKRISR